jgi:hypothetical protein
MNRVLLLVLALLALTTLALVGVSGEALAQTNNSTLNETAPYYVNQTTVGNQTGWLPSNITLDSLGDVVGRTGPLVIGSGEQIPGGTTFAGTLVTGLIIVAISLGAAAGTPLGWVGGAVVAPTLAYGLAELGLAPTWMPYVIVFIVGTVAAVAAYRTTS